MVKEPKLVLENDILATYEKDQKTYEIKLKDIRKYWDYASEDEIEGVRLSVYGDKIAILLLVASGQGGIVAIWDTTECKIIHVSEAAYTEAFDIFDGYVYTLLFVQNFQKPLTAMMSKAPIGTLDAFKENEIDKKFEFQELEEYDGKFDSIDLEVDAANYKIWIKDKEYVIER